MYLLDYRKLPKLLSSRKTHSCLSLVTDVKAITYQRMAPRHSEGAAKLLQSGVFNSILFFKMVTGFKDYLKRRNKKPPSTSCLSNALLCNSNGKVISQKSLNVVFTTNFVKNEKINSFMCQLLFYKTLGSAEM